MAEVPSGNPIPSPFVTWANRPLEVTDHGLLVGDGVFETVKVTEQGPFALDRHLDRLCRSAAALGLGDHDTDLEATRQGIASVLQGFAPRPCALRITWTSGPGPLGSPRGPGPHTVTVVAGPLTQQAATAAVALTPWPRNERGLLTGVKSTSYAENAAALAWAAEQGAGEAIFANLTGNLCEGTGSNIAVEHEGRLITPPLSSGCLAGVTRDLCLQTGLVVAADIPADRAWNETTEACLMSTTRDVQPIADLGHRTLPTPGPLTAALAEAFTRLAATL